MRLLQVAAVQAGNAPVIAVLLQRFPGIHDAATAVARRSCVWQHGHAPCVYAHALSDVAFTPPMIEQIIQDWRQRRQVAGRAVVEHQLHYGLGY